MKSFQEMKKEALNDYLKGLDGDPFFREAVIALNELPFVYTDFPSCAGHKEKSLKAYPSFMADKSLSLKMVLEPKSSLKDLISKLKQMSDDVEFVKAFAFSYTKDLTAKYALDDNSKLLFKVPVLNLELDLNNFLTESLKRDLVSLASNYDFIMVLSDDSFGVHYPIDAFKHVIHVGSDAIYVADKPVAEEYFSKWDNFWGELHALAETFKTVEQLSLNS